MSVSEFNMWIAYYSLQADEMEKQNRLARARR